VNFGSTFMNTAWSKASSKVSIPFSRLLERYREISSKIR